MQSKRGIGEIVGWVLLIGLSVAIATMVTVWTKQQASKTTEFIIEDIEGDIQCADTAFKAFIVTPPCTDINVSNTGYHKIVKFSLRHQFGTQEFPVDLLPQTDSKVLNMNLPSPSKVDIIPVIQSSKGLIGCADRKLVITC
ncbi:MAG: hypothetical protein AABX72_02010 [Nanoarchaeota archaeon]